MLQLHYPAGRYLLLLTQNTACLLLRPLHNPTENMFQLLCPNSRMLLPRYRLRLHRYPTPRPFHDHPADTPLADSCESTYATLLHTSSACRRPTLTRQTCAHCLRAARKMTAGAKACYCLLTRRLCRSVKSVAAGEFAGGCCAAERRRREGHKKLEEEVGEVGAGEGVGEKDMVGDVEVGGVYSRRLTLGVAGMHCSTCADDVAAIVGAVQGVDRDAVMVSFVLSRAEVRYDPRVEGVERGVAEKVLRRFPRLEVVVLGDVEEGEEERGVRARVAGGSVKAVREVLAGVNSVELCTEQEAAVEFAYNPDRIGIRRILGVLREADGFGEWQLEDVPDATEMAQDAEKRHLRKIGAQTTMAAIFTIPVLVLAWSGEHIKIAEKVRLSVEMACATVVMLIAHEIFLDAAWSLMFGGVGGFWSRINIDCLVSIATLSAYGFSVAVWGTHLAGTGYDTEPFFETSSLLITLILAGRWLTAGVRSWASKKLQAVGGDSAAKMVDCRLVDEETQRETVISVLELEYDDILAASQGEGIVTDGLIIEGTAQFDESHLTGEPKPQSKSAGSYVLAGSMVVSGDVQFRVAKLMQENTISTIKGMVKLAAQRPRAQEIADKVASILTPIILLIGIVVFVVWLLIGGLRTMPWGKSAIRATTYAVATLAISCPCAIGLAVPIVIVVASRIGISKAGLVLKNPAIIEKTRALGVVAFDKTGTLTTGQLQVENIWALDPATDTWTTTIPASTLAILRTLTYRSDHPVAKSITRAFSTTPPLPDISTTDHIGSGISATISNILYRGGKLPFTSPQHTSNPTITTLLSAAQTIFTLSANHTPILLVTLAADTIRPEAPRILAHLHSLNIKTYIFSGDRPSSVLPLAATLGIPPEHVFANCYPSDKAARLRILAAQHPGRTTMFVGDGTNDAVALAAADIGVSVSGGTEMAGEAADVVLVREGVEGVAGVLRLARRAQVCVAVNFCWAVCWNVFAVLAASGAVVKFRIEPEWAGAGEVGSVLPVFVVSLMVGVGWGGWR